MHLPDGFIDTRTALATAGAAALGLGYAARAVRRALPPRRVPLLGLVAATVFAAQMLNFPVAGGTSGHLVGGMLAAVLLGPSAGVLVIASVLIVQCLLFADGGLLALGANIFNMGIAGTAAAYGIYWVIRRVATGLEGQLAAAAFAAWCSVVLAAMAAAVELALSGTVPFGVVLPAMAGIHMLIGIGEAVITALVLASVAAARPELLRTGRESAEPTASGLIVYGLALAIGLALFTSPFASAWPDGLEKVTAALGFGATAGKPVVPAPFAGYAVPGIGSPAGATPLAGACGTVFMFFFAFLLARIVAPKEAGRRGTAGDP